jgi:hypothetical protein
MVSPVAPLLIWAGLAASFALAFAAVVQMAGPPAAAELRGMIRLPHEVTTTVVALFSLAAFVFFSHLIRRALFGRPGNPEMDPAVEPVRAPTWMRTLAQLASFAYFVALAYVLWRGAFPLGGLLGLGLNVGSVGGFGLPRSFPDIAPPLLNWSFGILALAAGVAALGLALWVAFAERLLARSEGTGDEEAGPPSLEAAVEESREDLHAEMDARRAIVRCYARFERVAAHSGIERQPWLTPMEFMRVALLRLPDARAAVPTLTGLFELAAYSQHALGPPERVRALDALDEIKGAIETRNRDGVAG